MKKKGFTLIELIVVIAILAILILLVLPNVLGLFNQAKEKAFVNELKEIYRAAQTKYAVDSVQGTRVQEYARNSEEECDNTLKLTGREDLDFLIRYDENGNVVLFRASDGSYQYDYSGPGLDIEDIKNAIDISDLSDNQIIKLTCDTTPGTTYFTSSNHRRIGNQMGGFITMYNSFDELKSATNALTFIQYKIENYNPQNITLWCHIDSYNNDCNQLKFYETEEECNDHLNTGDRCVAKDGKYIETTFSKTKLGFYLNNKKYTIDFNSEGDVVKAKDVLYDSFGKENCIVSRYARSYGFDAMKPSKSRIVSKIFGISEVNAATYESASSAVALMYCSYGNLEALLLNKGIYVQNGMKTCAISYELGTISSACGTNVLTLSRMYNDYMYYGSEYFH